MEKLEVREKIEEKVLRPKITHAERVELIASKFKTNPTTVVNFLVDLGLEILDRGAEEITNDFKKKLTDFLK